MISVIIPVYNAEKWIKKCLDSLIYQTMFEELELVLINDGSTDQSEGIIEYYANNYSNIIYKSVKNGGVSNARNIGIDMCSGEFITFVDADDYFDSEFVENMYNALTAECDISCSGFVAEYPNKSIKRSCNTEQVLNNREAMEAFLIGGDLEPNVVDKLFRREIIGNIKFDVNIKIAEDKYFLFQCLKKVRNIRLIPEANYHYLMNDSSACRSEFSKKNFDSVIISERIVKEIIEEYPYLSELAESMVIDVKCRVYASMYVYNAIYDYKKEYISYKSDIKKFRLRNKLKYSNKKHLIAFIAMKMHPELYCFLKNKLKLQYKGLG